MSITNEHVIAAARQLVNNTSRDVSLNPDANRTITFELYPLLFPPHHKDKVTKFELRASIRYASGARGHYGKTLRRVDLREIARAINEAVNQ